MQFLTAFTLFQQALLLLAGLSFALPTPSVDLVVNDDKPTLQYNGDFGLPPVIDKRYDVLPIINYWRVRVGSHPLQWSGKLEGNVRDTVNSAHGSLTHKLNPGTLAQVLAPGVEWWFENVWVGGWMCEQPNMSGMGDACRTWSKGWVYNGQTAHAQIVTSNAYSHIGCAFAGGIWGCDLGQG
ncbi:unnamed protein product [Periconia digitata]|uniref:SCP domain-containing protein n=1 Tax=Periconia digitata TaxID=1303443 RepID=A0A9W4U759_9PLEO|nr:unnamed protein product [Periconia digitata]